MPHENCRSNSHENLHTEGFRSHFSQFDMRFTTDSIALHAVLCRLLADLALKIRAKKELMGSFFKQNGTLAVIKAAQSAIEIVVSEAFNVIPALPKIPARREQATQHGRDVLQIARNQVAHFAARGVVLPAAVHEQEARMEQGLALGFAALAQALPDDHIGAASFVF